MLLNNLLSTSQRDTWAKFSFNFSVLYAALDAHYFEINKTTFFLSTGQCSYIFVTDGCDDKKAKFTITVENEPCGDEGYTCTKVVNMTIKNGVTLTLVKGADPIVEPAKKKKKFTINHVGIYLYVAYKGKTLIDEEWHKYVMILLQSEIDKSCNNVINQVLACNGGLHFWSYSHQYHID